jgi:hypothetical protein
MLRTRKRAASSASFRQRLQKLGAEAHTRFRRARVWLWRFKRSPEQQDRATAMATFVFIGLFAVGSVDAIVTGGADFNPGSAYAMDYAPAVLTPVPTAVTPDDLAPLATEAETIAAVESVDYSFTTEVLLGGPETAIAKPLNGEAAPDKPI